MTSKCKEEHSDLAGKKEGREEEREEQEESQDNKKIKREDKTRKLWNLKVGGQWKFSRDERRVGKEVEQKENEKQQKQEIKNQRKIRKAKKR